MVVIVPVVMGVIMARIQRCLGIAVLVFGSIDVKVVVVILYAVVTCLQRLPRKGGLQGLTQLRLRDQSVDSGGYTAVASNYCGCRQRRTQPKPAHVQGGCTPPNLERNAGAGDHAIDLVVCGLIVGRCGDETDAARLVLTRQPLEQRQLLETRQAPGSPEVHHDYVAA